MTSVALAPITHIRMSGVTWPTFKALMADMAANPGYEIRYDNAGLQISSSNFGEATLVLHGIRWQTYQALMAEVGDDLDRSVTFPFCRSPKCPS
jgi:hypothetical protein